MMVKKRDAAKKGTMKVFSRQDDKQPMEIRKPRPSVSGFIFITVSTLGLRTGVPHDEAEGLPPVRKDSQLQPRPPEPASPLTCWFSLPGC